MEKALEELLKYSQNLSHQKMVLGAGGNTSIKIRNKIYIKPSGLTFLEMTIKDWVAVNSEDNSFVSHPLGHQPSSELQMHLDIYKIRPDVTCIFHAHPPHIISICAAGLAIKHMFPDSVSYLGKIIPIVEYCVPCGEELANLVKNNIKNNNCVILRNHGALTLGNNPKISFLRMQVLEELAYMNWVASTTSISLGNKKDDFNTLSNKEVEEITNLKKIQYRKSLMDK